MKQAPITIGTTTTGKRVYSNVPTPNYRYSTFTPEEKHEAATILQYEVNMPSSPITEIDKRRMLKYVAEFRSTPVINQAPVSSKFSIPEIKVNVTFTGAKKSELFTIRDMNDAAEFFRDMMSDGGRIHFQEEFYMLCLNNANKCIGYYRVSQGGMTATVADLRIIATIALNCQATSIIVAHNHPSGNTQPSQADISMTKKLKDGLALFDIKLYDHIIITDESHRSLAEEGHIF